GTGVGQGDHRRCEEETRSGDQVLGHVDMPDYQLPRRMVEDATHLTRNSGAEEFGHSLRPDGRVLTVHDTHGALPSADLQISLQHQVTAAKAIEEIDDQADHQPDGEA